MRSTRPIAMGLVAALAALAAGLAWQHREAGQLREAIDRAQGRVRERDRLQAENRRLVAAQPNDAEMEPLVNRLTRAEQLKAQLAALGAREEGAAKAISAARDGASPPVPSL